MKNCAGNRPEGALRPQNRGKMKNLNKALLGTTHKLSLGIALRTLPHYRVQRVGRPQNADVLQETMK